MLDCDLESLILNFMEDIFFGGLLYADCRSAPVLFSAAAAIFVLCLLASAVALALSLSPGLNY